MSSGQKSRTVVVRNAFDLARLIAGLRKAKLGGEHRPLVVKVSRLNRKRTLSQNALMWSWNTILSEHVGCTPEGMHEDLCRELLGVEERTDAVTGEIRERVKGTRGFTTTQMQAYLERVAMLAAQHFGVALPSPDDPGAWDAYEASGMVA